MNHNRVAQTVAPTLKPVSVADAKRQLAIVHTSDDALIQSLIDAAVATIEGPQGIGIALCPATYTMSVDNLGSTIYLPINPVRSIVSIQYTDLDSVAQTIVGTLDQYSQPARVYLDTVPHSKWGTARISWTAGYDTVPADLRQAILMLAGHFYENREATSDVKLETVPMAVETILNRYRA